MGCKVFLSDEYDRRRRTERCFDPGRQKNMARGDQAEVPKSFLHANACGTISPAVINGVSGNQDQLLVCDKYRRSTGKG